MAAAATAPSAHASVRDDGGGFSTGRGATSASHDAAPPPNMEQMYMQQQRTTLTAGPGQSIVTRTHYAYLTPAEYRALHEHMRSVAIRTHTLAAFNAHTHQACGLIEATASRLGFPRRTIATAQLLYTRFHLTYSPSDFLLHEVALACLVLASKICDTPKRTREMVVASYALRHPEKCKITTAVAVPASQAKAAMAALAAGKEYHAPTAARSRVGGGLGAQGAPSGTASSIADVPASRQMGTIAESDIDPVRIETERGRILAIERLLLETTSFNFQVRAQSALALSFKLGRRLRAPRSLCDSAWRIAADAHRSPAPLIYPPLTIALASIYLAALFVYPPARSAVDAPHTEEDDRRVDEQYYAYFDGQAALSAAGAAASASRPTARANTAGPPSQRSLMGASIIGSSARAKEAVGGGGADSGGVVLPAQTPLASASSRGSGAVPATSSAQATPDGTRPPSPTPSKVASTLQGMQREAARLIMCFTASDGLFGDASTRPGGANRDAWKAQCLLQQQARQAARGGQRAEEDSGEGPARKRRKVDDDGGGGVEGMDVDPPPEARARAQAQAQAQAQDIKHADGSGSSSADALADEALWLALGSSSGVSQVESAALILLDLYIESLRLLSSSPPFSGPLPVQPAHLAAGTTSSSKIVTSAKSTTSSTTKMAGAGAGGTAGNSLNGTPNPSPFSPGSPRGAANGNMEEAAGDGTTTTTTTVVLVNTRQAPMPPSYALSPPPLEVLHVLNRGYGTASHGMDGASGGEGGAAGTGTGTGTGIAKGSADPSPISASTTGTSAPSAPPSPLELLQELDRLKLWLLRVGRRRERADEALLGPSKGGATAGPVGTGSNSAQASATTTTTAPNTAAASQPADNDNDDNEEEEERRATQAYARRRLDTARWRRWSAGVALRTDEGRMRGIVLEDLRTRARFGLCAGAGAGAGAGGGGAGGKGPPIEYKQGVVRFLF